MTCTEFQRWLDEDCPKGDLPRSSEHSAQCVRCEQQLAAAQELERLLAVVPPVEMAAGFNDAVILQIRAETRAGARRQALSTLGTIVAEPIVPLALATMAIIAPLFGNVAVAVDRLTSHPLGILSSPQTLLPLAVASAPLILWISWFLFRIFEQLTTTETPLLPPRQAWW
jgi:hypothetical protein